jgi:hypothetical protein
MPTFSSLFRNSLIRHFFTLLGIWGVLGAPPKASASIEREREILDSRVAAAREILRSKDTRQNLKKAHSPTVRNWRSGIHGATGGVTGATINKADTQA